ncbi:interferon-inducible GTPase 5-like [Paramuricea clavata]|uniref:Interferon-inducible GTPase 5-like n=1 Tax=Paramuricea clavata TaxID=317549 RepID=A0A7D9EK07_PARCT|nr:interferon-inducible GTPase 5-like [Paramuricea clavata]
MGKSQSKQQTSKSSKPEDEKSNYVRFALVGSSGSGMSAFVNAVRGFCDLPGYGTPSYPDVETYWRTLELEKFDRFLIFISLRVTEPDLALIKKVKSINKPFFLIRTKIDDNVECMKRKQKVVFKEEDLLLEIRNYILERTSHLSCAEEDIFIISNYDPRKWDFFSLIQAIINVMPAPEIGE